MVANKDQFATYSFLPITAKTLSWANKKLPSASRFCKFKHFKKYVFFLAFEKCGFQTITTISTVKMLKFITFSFTGLLQLGTHSWKVLPQA